LRECSLSARGAAGRRASYTTEVARLVSENRADSPRSSGEEHSPLPAGCGQGLC
jgi:hypothetical protein